MSHTHKIKQLEKDIQESRTICEKNDFKVAIEQIIKISKKYESSKKFKTTPYKEMDTSTPNAFGFYCFPPTDKQIKKLEEIIEEMELYLAELKDDDSRQIDKTKLSSAYINNINNNTASATISQNITIDSVINSIQSLPENVLDNESKEQLEEILSSIEILKNKDKSKVKSKLEKALKYIIDKGIEVDIEILPLFRRNCKDSKMIGGL